MKILTVGKEIPYYNSQTLARIRFLSSPYRYNVHLNYVDNIQTTCTNTNSLNCQHCLLGNKPSRRWIAGVILRNENDSKSNYNIIDFDVELYSLIQLLVRSNNGFSNPENYDIDIINDMNNLIVIPLAPLPLNQNDNDLKSNMNKEELNLFCNYESSYTFDPTPSFIRFLSNPITEEKTFNGLTCNKCNLFCSYANKTNQADGSFHCYSCRTF